MEQGNITRDFGMNYVSIPSDILQDVNISLKARGLYVTIMGLPRHWSLSIRGLLPILKESKNTICSILKELETYGYVSRSQSKDSSGKYGDIVYTLHARSAKLTDKTASEQEEEKQTHPCNAYCHKEERKSPSIKSRAKDFRITLDEYVDNPYTKDMIEAFYDYWSEPTPSGKKMKFELEKTWDVSRRLRTWKRNESKYGGKYNSNSRSEQRDIEKERRATEAKCTIISMLAEGDKSKSNI